MSYEVESVSEALVERDRLRNENERLVKERAEVIDEVVMMIKSQRGDTVMLNIPERLTAAERDEIKFRLDLISDGWERACAALRSERDRERAENVRNKASFRKLLGIALIVGIIVLGIAILRNLVAVLVQDVALRDEEATPAAYICPNAVCEQWLRDCTKIVPEPKRTRECREAASALEPWVDLEGDGKP